MASLNHLMNNLRLNINLSAGFLVSSFLFIAQLSFSQEFPLNVMPYPKKVDFGTGKFIITPRTGITLYGGCRDSILEEAANRMFRKLKSSTLSYFEQEKVKLNDQSGETAGGFSGVYVGMYATGNNKESTSYADYDWFQYEPGNAVR
jgi:hypothetical protein